MLAGMANVATPPGLGPLGLGWGVGGGGAILGVGSEARHLALACD